MTTTLDANKYGLYVQCVVCHQTKQPRGRSAPLQAHYCDSECPGYNQDPQVGSLWWGENEAEFGYPVGEIGTRIRPSSSAPPEAPQ